MSAKSKRKRREEDDSTEARIFKGPFWGTDESTEIQIFKGPFGGMDQSTVMVVSKIPLVKVSTPKKERPHLSKDEKLVKSTLDSCLGMLSKFHNIPRKCAIPINLQLLTSAQVKPEDAIK